MSSVLVITWHDAAGKTGLLGVFTTLTAAARALAEDVNPYLVEMIKDYQEHVQLLEFWDTAIAADDVAGLLYVLRTAKDWNPDFPEFLVHSVEFDVVKDRSGNG